MIYKRRINSVSVQISCIFLFNAKLGPRQHPALIICLSDTHNPPLCAVTNMTLALLRSTALKVECLALSLSFWHAVTAYGSEDIGT